MTSVSPTSPAGVQAPPSRKTLRKVAFASFAGTTIEFYDFFIYGTAAALVFPVVFFPALGAAAGTIASFGTFAVAFFARPVGAIIFGHFGDRIGRKKTLITTLLMMGIATVLIGFIPDANTIGVAAPIILVVLRFVQGLAVGGEWAGATLLVAEYAPKGKRGLFGSFPQIGPSVAFALASGTFLITNLTLGRQVRGLHLHRLAGAVHPQRRAGARGPVGPAEHRGNPGVQKRRQGQPKPPPSCPSSNRSSASRAKSCSPAAP